MREGSTGRPRSSQALKDQWEFGYGGKACRVCENHPKPRRLWCPGDTWPGLRSWLTDPFYVTRALKVTVLGPFPTRQVYDLPHSVTEPDFKGERPRAGHGLPVHLTSVPAPPGPSAHSPPICPSVLSKNPRLTPCSLNVSPLLKPRAASQAVTRTSGGRGCKDLAQCLAWGHTQGRVVVGW